MTKVLVTGASGFIGYHLAKALVARGDDVACLVRKTSKVKWLNPLGVTLAYGDVTDPESLPGAMAGKAIVYHLAGCTRALRRKQLFRVNEEGCRNVAEACALQATPPVLVVVSSLAAAGPSSEGRLRTEPDPSAPVSDYGRSKRAGELATEQFADRVPITVIRPGIVLGEADPVSLALFQTIQRLFIHFTAGPMWHRFSVIHAADVAALLILAAERGARLPAPAQRHNDSPPDQGYYFAACEENPTFGQLGKMIGEAMGRRFTLVVPLPLPLAWIAALLSEGVAQIVRRPFIFRLDKLREAAAGSWTCSAQKAMDELGYRPAMPLSDRLRQTIDWYRQQKWL